MTLGHRQRRTGTWLGATTLGAALAAIALWLAGLIWFSQQIAVTVEDPDSVTDAIVVLTGGPGRLVAGLELLAGGKAKKLFVSGVYRGVDMGEILRVSRQSPKELECCIVLGHSAVDTAGNARETAKWMAAEGYRSLRLVTANYHMPRSLAEFRSAMPWATLVAHPIVSANIHIESWWRWPGTTALLAGEFSKYVVSMVRPRWNGDE